jgi:Protein of unknown function (DUF5818)
LQALAHLGTGGIRKVTHIFVARFTVFRWILAKPHPRSRLMGQVGTRIQENGTLIRHDGGFALRRDVGGRWRLDLHRVPVDHVEKRVRITGVIVAEDLVDVDGVALDA